MKQALITWVEQEEERNRLTREALSDVDTDTDSVIDQRVIQAWTDSLSSDAPLPVPRGLN